MLFTCLQPKRKLTVGMHGKQGRETCRVVCVPGHGHLSDRELWNVELAKQIISSSWKTHEMGMEPISWLTSPHQKNGVCRFEIQMEEGLEGICSLRMNPLPELLKPPPILQGCPGRDAPPTECTAQPPQTNPTETSLSHVLPEAT